MKIIIFIIPICFLSVQSYSQILTSEIAVEPTGNKTIVSGLLEVKAPYDGISQFTVNTTSSNAELRFSKNDTIKGFIWYNASNNLMAFGRGSATNSFFTTTDGKFGVGTTTPRGKLEIKAPYSGDSQLIINTTSSNAELRFSKNSTTKGFVWYDASNDLMAFGRGSATNSFFTTTDGKFGVGTTNPTEKLHVNGNIRATAPVWADFVFDKTYELQTLEEVENYINKHKHLSEIPTESEVAKNGINLGEMDAKLLQKIEELTLYTIQQEKKLQNLQNLFISMQKELEILKVSK